LANLTGERKLANLTGELTRDHKFYLPAFTRATHFSKTEHKKESFVGSSREKVRKNN